MKSTHAIGVILVSISAIVFSSAGLFTKGVGAGPWEIIFWRSIFAIGFTAVYIFWRGTAKAEFVDMGRSGVAIALVGASGSAAFIPALKLTTMANVAIIYAAAPLLAAILAWGWIGERITRKLMIGCAVAFLGVAIIFQGSVGTLHLKGDILALWMTCTLAIIMVMYRRYPDTPAAGPAVLASLILLPPAVILIDPFAIPLTDIVVSAIFGLVFAIGSVTLAEGAKRLPAGEAALLSALETPLAPLLGWLAFTEVPAMATFGGGALVLAAVVWTQFSR